jgi:hypothetical protein
MINKQLKEQKREETDFDLFSKERPELTRIESSLFYSNIVNYLLLKSTEFFSKRQSKSKKKKRHNTESIQCLSLVTTRNLKQMTLLSSEINMINSLRTCSKKFQSTPTELSNSSPPPKPKTNKKMVTPFLETIKHFSGRRSSQRQVLKFFAYHLRQVLKFFAYHLAPLIPDYANEGIDIGKFDPSTTVSRHHITYTKKRL